MLVPPLSAFVRLKPRGVWLKPGTTVLLVATVVCVCAAREQASEMRIRLKSVEIDPRTTKQVVVPPDWDRWIVQFARPLTREDMERVQREWGLALQRYIPDGAYLERVDAQLVARLEVGTRWCAGWGRICPNTSSIQRSRDGAQVLSVT